MLHKCGQCLAVCIIVLQWVEVLTVSTQPSITLPIFDLHIGGIYVWITSRTHISSRMLLLQLICIWLVLLLLLTILSMLLLLLWLSRYLVFGGFGLDSGRGLAAGGSCSISTTFQQPF